LAVEAMKTEFNYHAANDPEIALRFGLAIVVALMIALAIRFGMHA
jgi:hypothetical protein